jgi:hypothetical protein
MPARVTSMHIHAYLHEHAHTHTYIHADTHTCMHACMRTHTYISQKIKACFFRHSTDFSQTLMEMLHLPRKRTCMHIHAYAGHARMHPCVCMHVQAHLHATRMHASHTYIFRHGMHACMHARYTHPYATHADMHACAWAQQSMHVPAGA